LIFAVFDPEVPIILGDALRNSRGVGCAGLHDQYGILLESRVPQGALNFYLAINDFHSLHALVQIDTKLGPPMCGEHPERRTHFQGFPKAGRQSVKRRITLAKIHMIDETATGSEC
jgi:hypothetical protein